MRQIGRPFSEAGFGRVRVLKFQHFLHRFRHEILVPRDNRQGVPIEHAGFQSITFTEHSWAMERVNIDGKRHIAQIVRKKTAIHATDKVLNHQRELACTVVCDALGIFGGSKRNAQAAAKSAWMDVAQRWTARTK